MTARWLSVALLLAFPASSPAADRPEADPGDWIYAIRPGENLWTLSRQYLLGVNYCKRLQALNGIADPLHIPPGTRLRLPFAWLRAQPAPARVLAVAGRAEVSRTGTHETAPLEAESLLHVGDTLTTNPGASATIVFADDSRLLVAEKSVVVFDRLSSFGQTGMVDTSIHLERGRSESHVSPRRGRFKIASPAAVTVVRGTTFRTSFDEGEQVERTEVTEGVVANRAGATTRDIGPGFGAVVHTGQAPTPPVPLLPAPNLADLPPSVRRFPATLAMPAGAGAASYRLQLATDERFETLAVDLESANGQFVLKDLPDGSYALRARAIDAMGLAGQDAVARLDVDARPEPPVLVSPAPGSLVLEPRPAFSWSTPSGNSGFRFQLARSGEGAAPLVDVDTHSSSLASPSPLLPGAYEWRVAARDSGGLGPFGDAQPFTRRDMPAAPEARAPVVVERTLTLAWSAGGVGQQFRLQLARDAEFSQPLLDRTVGQPSVEIERPRKGRYFLRLQTIDADGLAGPFGTPQTIEVPRPARSWSYWLAALTVPLLGFLVH